MTLKYHWLKVFCDVIGWIYFIAWSISFYPQAILNYRRKCVAGMSFDYVALYNGTGFIFYSIYCIAIFVHNNGISNHSNPIAINDIAFACHALLLTSIQCIQILIYDRAGQRPSMFAILLTGILWVLTMYNIALSITHFLPWFGSMSTIACLGYAKVIITTVKYTPPAYMNFKDKSTLGWSIHNMLLDFTGGSLSVMQQLLTAYNTNDWTYITHNIPKFILGMESMIFDILFVVQHYILYGPVIVQSRMADVQKNFTSVKKNERVIAIIDESSRSALMCNEGCIIDVDHYNDNIDGKYKSLVKNSFVNQY